MNNIYINKGGNATNMVIIANNPWNYNICVNNMNGMNGMNNNMNSGRSRRFTTVTAMTYPQNTQQQPQKSANKSRPERNVNFYLCKLFNEIINQNDIISTLSAFKLLFEKLALKVTLKIFGIELNEQIVSNMISNKWMKELTNWIGFVRGVNGYVSAAESIGIYSRIASVTKEMNGYLLDYHRKYNISVLNAMNDICDEDKCKVNGTVYLVHHLKGIVKRLYNNHAIGPINRKQLLLFINYAQKNGQITVVMKKLRQIHFNGYTILSNAKFNAPMDVVRSSFGEPQITISPSVGQFNYEIVQNLAQIAKRTKEPEIGGNFKYSTFVYKCDNNVTIEFAKNNLTVLNVKCDDNVTIKCPAQKKKNKVKMNANAAPFQP